MLSDLLGKKFEYNGRGPDSFDCFGLATEVLQRQGITLPAIQSETEAAAIHAQILFTQENPLFKKLSEPEPWVIVTFMVRPPYTSHVGIVLEDCRRFIHIMEKRSVTIERLDAIEWQRRITGFFAINKERL